MKRSRRENAVEALDIDYAATRLRALESLSVSPSAPCTSGAEDLAEGK